MWDVVIKAQRMGMCGAPCSLAPPRAPPLASPCPIQLSAPHPAPSFQPPSFTIKETLLLTVTHLAHDVGKAALLMICALEGFDLPLPPGVSYAEHVGTSADTLAEICERLHFCFGPGAPGFAITGEQVKERALQRAPGGAAAAAPAGAAEEAAGGKEEAAGATEAAGAESGAAAAPAADSPPTAHDSASSHQLTAGTALASRKRGREGGADAEEGAPLAKQQQQQMEKVAGAAAGVLRASTAGTAGGGLP